MQSLPVVSGAASSLIHRTAVIHPKAELGPSVTVGPYAVIDEHVVVGAGCRIGPHVHLTGRTIIGANNSFHAGCVIGDAPQHLNYRTEPTHLSIGDGNVFREHVTVHRSNNPSEATVVGAGNYFMASSHAGHNVQVGDSVIVANGALLAGHAVVEDQAFVSGNCQVHQFVRMGRLAIMQGGSSISKDLPPYCVARGVNGMCGLNTVGMRRAGLTREERMELQRLYHLMFRSRQKLRVALEAARGQFVGERALELIQFVADSRRGVCRDTGLIHGAEWLVED